MFWPSRDHTGFMSQSGLSVTRIACSPGWYIQMSVVPTFGFSIAPDGRRVAAARRPSGAIEKPKVGTTDIWMYQPGEHAIRVTDNPDWDMNPVWSRDGQNIVYASRRQGRARLYRRNPTAIAPEELLLDSDTAI